MVEIRHVELRRRLDGRDKTAVVLAAVIAAPLMLLTLVGGMLLVLFERLRLLR